MSIMPVYCSGCGDLVVHCKCWDFRGSGPMPSELEIPCDAPLKVAEEARPIYTFKHKQFVAVLKQPFTEEEERVMREYLDFVDEKRK